MTAVDALHAGSVWVVNGVLAWLCGSMLARRWLGATAEKPGARCEAALARGDRYALCAAIAGAFAAMWSAFADMAGLPLREVGPMLADILAGTLLGQTYLLAMTALVLAALARVLRWPAALAAALLVVFALGRAQLSHAGGLPGAGMLIDAAHLLLTAVWSGTVFVAAWLVVPACGGEAPLAFMERLSRAAALALAGIVASGLYAASQRLGAPQRLFDHPYGLVLSIKLALVGIAVCLGAWNRFIGFPAAARDGAAKALLVLRIESVLLLAALGAASILAQQQPPL